MRRIYINVSNETVDYLQRLDFEMTANRNIITAIFDQHKYDTDASILESIPFKKYHDQYKEMVTQWEIAKKNVPDTCLPEWLKKYQYNWYLDTIKKVFRIDIISAGEIPELEGYEVEEAASGNSCRGCC